MEDIITFEEIMRIERIDKDNNNDRLHELINEITGLGYEVTEGWYNGDTIVVVGKKDITNEKR